MMFGQKSSQGNKELQNIFAIQYALYKYSDFDGTFL